MCLESHDVLDSEDLIRASLIVFPNLPEKSGGMLDALHQGIKDVFIENRLMVAQFHPSCDQRGIYNAGWKSQQSPIPLLAIRHMQIHDILFIGDNRDWFDRYNIEFGHKFKEPKTLDDFEKRFLSAYETARKKFKEEGRMIP